LGFFSFLISFHFLLFSFLSYISGLPFSVKTSGGFFWTFLLFFYDSLFLFSFFFCVIGLQNSRNTKVFPSATHESFLGRAREKGDMLVGATFFFFLLFSSFLLKACLECIDFVQGKRPAFVIR